MTGGACSQRIEKTHGKRKGWWAENTSAGKRWKEGVGKKEEKGKKEKRKEIMAVQWNELENGMNGGREEKIEVAGNDECRRKRVGRNPDEVGRVDSMVEVQWSVKVFQRLSWSTFLVYRTYVLCKIFWNLALADCQITSLSNLKTCIKITILVANVQSGKKRSLYTTNDQKYHV